MRLRSDSPGECRTLLGIAPGWGTGTEPDDRFVIPPRREAHFAEDVHRRARHWQEPDGIGGVGTGADLRGIIRGWRAAGTAKVDDPEVATYAPKFIAALQKQGFKVGETNNVHAMQLRLAFNGNPFDTRVAAELWHDGVPILTASATNSGWGTMIAHGAAVENLADSAVTIFEKKLSELRPHLRVVEDPGQQHQKSTTVTL